MKFLIKYILAFITSNYPDKDQEEIEIIQYGLEGILLTIPKTLFLLSLGYLLGIFIPLIVAMISFGLLRIYASGVHLKSGWTCTLFTSALFLIICYAGLNIVLSVPVKAGIFALSMLLLVLYAPADTEERPLVNEKTRKDLKFSSLLITCGMFVVAMILPGNNAIGNIITWSVIVESVMTTPMIYHFFRRRYRNYEYES